MGWVPPSYPVLPLSRRRSWAWSSASKLLVRVPLCGSYTSRSTCRGVCYAAPWSIHTECMPSVCLFCILSDTDISNCLASGSDPTASILDLAKVTEGSLLHRLKDPMLSAWRGGRSAIDTPACTCVLPHSPAQCSCAEVSGASAPAFDWRCSEWPQLERQQLSLSQRFASHIALGEASL